MTARHPTLMSGDYLHRLVAVLCLTESSVGSGIRAPTFQGVAGRGAIGAVGRFRSVARAATRHVLR
jgi:hypothetical protein